MTPARSFGCETLHNGRLDRNESLQPLRTSDLEFGHTFKRCCKFFAEGHLLFLATKV